MKYSLFSKLFCYSLSTEFAIAKRQKWKCSAIQSSTADQNWKVCLLCFALYRWVWKRHRRDVQLTDREMMWDRSGSTRLDAVEWWEIMVRRQRREEKKLSTKKRKRKQMKTKEKKHENAKNKRRGEKIPFTLNWCCMEESEWILVASCELICINDEKNEKIVG